MKFHEAMKAFEEGESVRPESWPTEEGIEGGGVYCINTIWLYGEWDICKKGGRKE